MSGDKFVIRRNGAFFRPNAAGYTNHVIAAGFYSREEADRYADVEGVTIEPLSRYRDDAERTIAEAQRLLDALSATPSHRLDAATVERAARAMCVADGLDPDEHIIGGQATGFEDFGPLWQAEERSEGQLGLTNYKRLATAALATEPHQHGGKGA